MPDICMCTGEDCQVKNDCYRYRATPSHMQTYFFSPPTKGGYCEYFWLIDKDCRVRSKDEIDEKVL